MNDVVNWHCAGMIDATDEAILAQLMKDGRRSVVRIAHDLRVPRATVQDRIRRLAESGVIRRFVAVPDYAKLGKGTTAYVLVSFGGRERVSQRALAEEIARIPEVQEVSLISGEWDILLKIRATSVGQVGKLVIDRLRMMRGVEKTQTCISFEMVKEAV